MFIVKELIISSLDGTCEANILGLYKTEEKALEKLKKWAKENLTDMNDFYNCDLTGPEELMEAIPNCDNRDYVIDTENRLLCISSKDCWYEYYLEVTIEEIEIQE